MAGCRGGGERSDVAVGGQGSAQLGDLVVLGGQPGDCSGPELCQFCNLLFGFEQTSAEVRVLVLEPDDLRGSRIRQVAVGLHLGEAAGEFVLEVPVAAVEGGAGDAGFTRQRGDIAAAAGRDLPAKQPVHGGADAVLGLAPLDTADCHWRSLAAAWSMAAATWLARSCSAARRFFSPAGMRGLPRKTSVVVAQPAQASRCSGWKVACGQRAASHIPASGWSAVGVPASLRQSALAGLVNQQ